MKVFVVVEYFCPGSVYIYSRTRLVRTRDTTYFGLVCSTHFSEPEFIYYIDSYAISTMLVRTYGYYVFFSASRRGTY